MRDRVQESGPSPSRTPTSPPLFPVTPVTKMGRKNPPSVAGGSAWRRDNSSDNRCDAHASECLHRCFTRRRALLDEEVVRYTKVAHEPRNRSPRGGRDRGDVVVGLRSPDQPQPPSPRVVTHCRPTADSARISGVGRCATPRLEPISPFACDDSDDGRISDVGVSVASERKIGIRTMLGSDLFLRGH